MTERTDWSFLHHVDRREIIQITMGLAKSRDKILELTLEGLEDYGEIDPDVVADAARSAADRWNRKIRELRDR